MSERALLHPAHPEARADAPASFVVYPAPRPENGMGTLGAFALGVVTGIVGVAVAAVIVDKLENSDGCKGDAAAATSAKASGVPDLAQDK